MNRFLRKTLIPSLSFGLFLTGWFLRDSMSILEIQNRLIEAHGSKEIKDEVEPSTAFDLTPNVPAAAPLSGQKKGPKSNQVSVFYNVFTKDLNDTAFEESTVREQSSLLCPEHHVNVRSIGVKLDIDNVTMLQHDETGDEVETLSLLWHHCLDHPDQTVVYIHGKGSFHPSKDDEPLRRHLTRGALSRECAEMPSSCDVCSSRMSPLPHPHTPGNMWAARCSHVVKLFYPLEFQKKMGRIHPRVRSTACFGVGRYSVEHWIHSHPTVKPCDVSNDAVYSWNYENIPNDDFEIDLKPAPRHEPKFYWHGFCRNEKAALLCATHIAEYKNLHNESVPEDWWGFNFFPPSTQN